MKRSRSGVMLMALLACSLVMTAVAVPQTAGARESPRAKCKVAVKDVKFQWTEDASGLILTYGFTVQNCKARISRVQMSLYTVRPNGKQDENAPIYVLQKDQANKAVTKKWSMYIIPYMAYSFQTVPDLLFFVPRDDKDALGNCVSTRGGRTVDLSGFEFYLRVIPYDTKLKPIPGKGVVTERVSCGQDFTYPTG